MLADINDFTVVNDVYKQYFKGMIQLEIDFQLNVKFSDKFPARAAYQVAHLPKNGRVEIEAIAVLGNIKDA